VSRVEVNIEEVDDIENERGDLQQGVRATCSECDHVTESFGTGPRSRVRCIMKMKEECPNNEENFYVDADE
jgi:hypothetical protein